jgi:DNA (cytosine-5)-methyltransferase 1
MGYARAGFEVVGVDIRPMPRYPFEFHQADALEYLAEHGREFDAVHASPPCQSYTQLAAVNARLGRTQHHPALIEATRAALRATGRPYVIENVVGAPLLNPVRLCGSSFGLPIRRHRLFESSVFLLGLPCNHAWQSEPKYWTSWRPNGERRLSTVVQVYGNGGNQAEWAAALGIDWMNKDELREAIPPAFSEFVGRQLLAALQARVA